MLRSRIRRCPECGTYTLRDRCAACGDSTLNTFPPRYSPVDRFGKYRRKYYKEGRELEESR